MRIAQGSPRRRALSATTADGRDKGEVHRQHGKWWWTGRYGSTEPFPQDWTAENVRDHAAHLAREPLTLQSTDLHRQPS